MFVSSYATYLQVPSSNKETRQRDSDAKSSSDFGFKTAPKSLEEFTQKPSARIDYISRSNTFYTKLFLEQHKDERSQETKELSGRFNQQITLQEAKSAYEQAPKTASIFKEALESFSKTKEIEEKLEIKMETPLEELQAKKMKESMINAYKANQNYSYARSA